MENGELRMMNCGVHQGAGAAREDLEGIGELPPEDLSRGKIVAQLQPALAGEWVVQT